MTATRRFFNVTVMDSRDDDGITVTFATAREAADYCEWAKNEGMWLVQMWS